MAKVPDVSRALFVADNATVLGDVVLGRDASVFYGAVLRADINEIVVGAGTNLQDGVIVHLADDAGVKIGDWCTVGHGAILHACTVEEECLIGMRATVLDHAKIGARSLVAAGALVPPRFECPPGSMVMGVPARVVRALTEKEMAAGRKLAEKYLEVAKAHRARQERLG